MAGPGSSLCALRQRSVPCLRSTAPSAAGYRPVPAIWWRLLIRPVSCRSLAGWPAEQDSSTPASQLVPAHSIVVPGGPAAPRSMHLTCSEAGAWPLAPGRCLAAACRPAGPWGLALQPPAHLSLPQAKQDVSRLSGALQHASSAPLDAYGQMERRAGVRARAGARAAHDQAPPTRGCSLRRGLGVLRACSNCSLSFRPRRVPSGCTTNTCCLSLRAPP